MNNITSQVMQLFTTWNLSSLISGFVGVIVGWLVTYHISIAQAKLQSKEGVYLDFLRFASKTKPGYLEDAMHYKRMGDAMQGREIDARSCWKPKNQGFSKKDYG